MTKKDALVKEMQRYGYTLPEVMSALQGLDPTVWFERYPAETVPKAIARIAASTGRSGGSEQFLNNAHLLWPDTYKTPTDVKTLLTNHGIKEGDYDSTKEAEYWNIVWAE